MTIHYAFGIGLLVLLLALPTATAVAQPFEPLPAVDLATLSPADFTDDELDTPAGGNNASHGMPYLLAHFKTFADGVSDGSGGTPRGFIDLVVWRGAKDNRPHNMRIMENNLSLAYFYVTDRPWNVYRGHLGVRQRLEAALAFMLGEQGPDGQFSEYVPKKWGLAPTAFGTKFLGQTLTLLKRPGAPPVDPNLLDRVVRMQRRAILFVLSDDAFYTHGKRFTNQFGNVWAGGLAYLALFPDDAEVRQKLETRFAGTARDFFSPPGFPYENDGPDWSYNLGTHASNQRMARAYTRDATHPMHAQLVAEEQAFHEWLSYNAVPVPGQGMFVLNRGVETRGNVGFDGLAESNFADKLEIVRAFAPTDEEVNARRAAARSKAERAWPKVEPLEVGEFRAYSPYEFLHREHAATHPTAGQREAARAKYLPYLAGESFSHQRVDDRRDPAPAYTFVRRPAYYAAFNSGNQKNEQRLGLGLLWHPKLGPLLQSQTGSAAHAWGTRADDGSADDGKDVPYEAGTLPARFSVGGEPFRSPQTGVHALAAGDLVAAYDLGTRGSKQVRFLDDRIEVEITHPGAFREQIPLLVLPDDRLITDGSVTLGRAGGELRIDGKDAARITTAAGDTRIGPYVVTTVTLHGREKLAYAIRVTRKR